MADSNFAQASYNNCTSKEFFSFRYTLVATNRNKVGLFGGVLSGIWWYKYTSPFYNDWVLVKH